MKDDRPRPFPLQYRVDVPDQLLAPCRVGLARLLVKQILEPAIAVSGEVAVRLAGVAFIQLLVGVVDNGAARVFQPDYLIPARDLRVPVSGFDNVELAGDEDFFELVDPHDRRVPVERDVAGRHLDRELVVWARMP